MLPVNNSDALWADLGTVLPTPAAKSIPYVLATFIVVLFMNTFWKTKPSAPLLTPKQPFEFSETRVKKEYVAGAREMLRSWFASNPDKPVRLNTDVGEMTILPPYMADEIRNDARLSFGKWTCTAFHAHIPGFEGFREGFRDNDIFQKVIMKDLTKHLNKVTEPLAEETAMALPEIFTENPEWHALVLRDAILRLVARISSRVFLGDQLCRNEGWLRVTREYTTTAFRAAEELRLWPAALRPLVHWFLPNCQQTRAIARQARAIVGPLVEERRREKAAARAQGKEAARYEDAIEWFEECANGSYYDPAVSQLIMSVAAIHTTTDLVCQVLAELVRHPEVVEDLRGEMSRILGEEGWKKTSLYHMKLLDSVIKESQRRKPIGMVTMRRYALQTIHLSDGTVVPKGNFLAVSSHKMWDPAVYPDAEKWDAYRFLRMRETQGREHAAQSVSTGPEFLAFGHGQHACPGRFFAVNEVKVALIHILLMYDLRLPEGADTKPLAYGFSLGLRPDLKMDVRRREGVVGL